MRKIYHLKTCSTCARIIKELDLENQNFEFQDIKTQQMTEAQLEEMKAMAGDFESLFSRRSLKYKAWELKGQNLTEEDYKKYILEEYTFLKRPVIIIDDQIFVGNSPKTIEQVKKMLA